MNKTKLTLLAIVAAGTSTAWAVNPPTNLSDTSRVYDLDEVLVVSQPKEQYRLRQQPISSTMFSGVTMERVGTRDLRELSAYVPNFTMPNYGSRYTSSMYVRGIGSRINSPALGIYVDGMPLMSKSAFNTHLYDLQRVDVLRGPQGTLYGLNTEGGLVRLYTLNPMNYQGTDIKVGGASHFYRQAEVSHYQRLSDKVAFSLAGFYDGQKGFFRNQANGKRADKYDEAGGRLRLVFRPAPRWDINYVADYQYVRQNGFPYGLMGDDGIAENPNTNRQGNYRRNIFNTALDLHFRANAFDLSYTGSYQYLKDYMLMDIDYQPTDFMHMEERQFQNAFTQELVLKGNHAVGGFWRWTVGAFQGFSWLKTRSTVFFDPDMDDFLGNNIQRSMQNAIINSMAAGFMARGMSQEQALAMATATIQRAGGISMQTDMQDVPGNFHTPLYNLGVYHESNFDITPRLTATLGLRYDWSYVSIDYDTQASMTSVASVMGRKAAVDLSSHLNDSRHNHFDQLLPKFGLTWRVADNGSNIYATVSKGYRAGGYNIQMFSDVLQAELQANSSQRADYDIPHTQADYDRLDKTISYKPETSWNYEAGTHLNLFGNKVQLDLSAFFMQVRNQQLSVMAGNYGFGRTMTNAGKSNSCGAELTLRGHAVDNRLAWQVGYGYTHADFRDYVDSVTTGTTSHPINYKGNRVPFVPEHNFSAAVDYTFPLSLGEPQTSCVKLQSLTVGVNVNGQGKTWWDEANTMSQKLYAVMGAHVGFDLGLVSLNIWGRNLTCTRYNVFAVSSRATGQNNWYAQRGNPFQVGADVKVHF